MNSASRAELLKYVRAGHDIEAAAAMAGIEMVEIRKSGQKLNQQLADAYTFLFAALGVPYRPIEPDR